MGFISGLKKAIFDSEDRITPAVIILDFAAAMLLRDTGLVLQLRAAT